MIELSKDYYSPVNMKCEIWRNIQEFQHYALSNYGRVRRTDKGNIIKPEIIENKDGTTTYYFKLYENGKRFTYNLKYLMIQATFEQDTEPPLAKQFDLIYNKNDEFIYKCY